MSNIKHGPIVNKTDFWSWNSIKIAGTVDIRRKTVFLEFLMLYFIYLFFHEIRHTDVKWQYLKCDGAGFSKNIFFSAENAGNIPENRFLGIFSRFYH